MAATRLILGTRKGVIILDAAGGGWTPRAATQLGIPVPYAVSDPRSGRLWASLDHGHWGQKLVHSDDDGATWAEVAAPVYPEGEELKPGKPASLRLIWVITPGPADQPGRLWLGTEPGGLFRSDDGGGSWQLVESLWRHPSRPDNWFGGGRDEAGIHSVLVDPRDSRRVLVGVSCAGVFESRDDGVTWTTANRGLKAGYLPDPDVDVGHDPHLVVGCPTNFDALWQQNHCGIFRSRDGGANWSQVSEEGGPAHFGFAVAVDPADGDTAWVVPAIADECRVAVGGALCVSRSEDGGKTWTALRKGLPQEHCYDIVFRHALDIDDSGRTLAFGSTSGNLYVSGDRGDSWQCLGTHFPPIYSVRFAQ
ncbi:glycosyl hydrolase [bacterium]|nr:glycosyl hydrolase [bacterium]